MAAWLEDLLADERYYLIKEMKESRIDGSDDPVKLSEVRLAEKVLRYVRGSMEEAGWETTDARTSPSTPTASES